MGEKECVYCLNKRVINSQSRQNVAVLGMIWGWLGCVVWSWFVFWVMGNTFVFNVSDITVISVSGIGNNLGTAIGKSNTVFTSDNITVTVFISGKISLGVVILNSITILVNSWAIIGWVVIRSWFVYDGSMIRSWSWVVYWGSFVCWGGVVWDGMMDSWVSIGGGMYWDMSWSMNGGTIF